MSNFRAGDQPLIPAADFGQHLSGRVHLAAGGESPRLAGSAEVFSRYEALKSQGVAGRSSIIAEVDRVRTVVAALVGAEPSWVGFPGNVATGMSLLAQSLQLDKSVNVVVPTGEFPSVVYPWAGNHPNGVRVCPPGANDDEELENLERCVDAETRVIALSLVSYFDGRRRNLAPFRAIADRVGAYLVVDASHALGSIEVSMEGIDFLFSTCYKWQLGIHGCAIGIWNRVRIPDWTIGPAGWASAIHEEPLLRGHAPHLTVEDGRRFELGNPACLSVHLLGHGLSALQRHGISQVEAHNLDLSGRLIVGLTDMGVLVETPSDARSRAGNVSILTDQDTDWLRLLESHKVIAWAGQGRLRFSTHAYNGGVDVEAALASVRRGLSGGLTLRRI